ncbi:uncharacterized protein C8Q71DRAFT_788669 [Rhodofomes roseus]|uniref:NYN domain-containing protein n=1 Tax=Rhodofomes roseus TaxID=34475 RepID=A0ABQ8JZK7_9APHY|nr:uncharacterized protein C8Q71DRAFT_788669 [Rhodofomes roseus]KAH9829830.1 hypothetical protein C8Q71DRAFT_788669 [Rhodofomes roseus]
MTQSVSDSTLSPTPFSPFSSYSEVSGVTSDDAPDLGAFTTVFRALNNLQQRTAPALLNDVNTGTPISPLAFSPTADGSEAPLHSAPWSHHPVNDYLSYSSPDSPRRGRSPLRSDSESTASDVDRSDLLRVEAEVAELIDQPSLGDLDEALGFLAAERARLLAQRKKGLRTTGNTSSTTTTSDSIYRHVIQPRRKRRRKRNRSEGASRVRASEHDQDHLTETSTTAGVDDVGDDGGDEAYASSSSVEIASSPSAAIRTATASARVKTVRRQPTLTQVAREKPRLLHSKSTPNLIPPVSLPLDARVLHLRNLAHKLRLFFPKDAVALHDVLDPETAFSATGESGFVDTRGPEPGSQDTLIHVFIDHSNILIGFLSYLRRHLHHYARSRGRYLSHAALALILERGRPITRRVLVASSPLYQPVDSAGLLGYEVRVYARVPDTGDGADRQRHALNHNQSEAQSPGRGRGRRAGASHARSHSHKSSIGGGGTSTESETNGNGNGNGNGAGASARVRYREQGVDELLQLKLHQAIADIDEVPTGATIVLATGDGNVGQFNEEGFLGCVRTALKKGWRVELYAWEGGLSNAWLREFGDGAYSSRFEVHTLDRFAADLLEV